MIDPVFAVILATSVTACSLISAYCWHLRVEAAEMAMQSAHNGLQRQAAIVRQLAEAITAARFHLQSGDPAAALDSIQRMEERYMCNRAQAGPSEGKGT